MPQSQNTSSKPLITEQPSCPSCTALMRLVEITPEKEGYDRRTFECPKCKHSHIVVVRFWC